MKRASAVARRSVSSSDALRFELPKRFAEVQLISPSAVATVKSGKMKTDETCVSRSKTQRQP